MLNDFKPISLVTFFFFFKIQAEAFRVEGVLAATILEIQDAFARQNFLIYF